MKLVRTMVMMMYSLNTMRSATVPETMVEAVAAKALGYSRSILRRNGLMDGGLAKQAYHWKNHPA